jgi:hypothetical protein
LTSTTRASSTPLIASRMACKYARLSSWLPRPGLPVGAPQRGRAGVPGRRIRFPCRPSSRRAVRQAGQAQPGAEVGERGASASMSDSYPPGDECRDRLPLHEPCSCSTRAGGGWSLGETCFGQRWQVDGRIGSWRPGRARRRRGIAPRSRPARWHAGAGASALLGR